MSWEVSDTSLRVMNTDSDWGFPGVPDLWIYFRFVDANRGCELVWMELAEPPETADWEDIDP